MTIYYRFRPLSRLLGDTGELETQTIYFAGQGELNDPMEGFAEVVFRGDRVLWENLLRHFIRCLGWAITRHRLTNGEEAVTWDQIPWFDSEQATNIPLLAIVESVADRLVANEHVQKLLDHWSARQDEVSEDEVAMYLAVLHPQWSMQLFEEVSPDQIDPKVLAIPLIDFTAMMNQVEAMLSADRSHIARPVPVSSLFAVWTFSSQENRLLDRSGRQVNTSPAYRFVFVDFVEAYIRQLRKLMYPDWYTACFMEDMSNASVWGHYAGGHADVCLKFRATPSNGRDTLSLSAPVGIDANGAVWQHRPFYFKPVSYGSNSVRLNFFESLGRLPIPVLNRTWLTGRSGDNSPLVGRLANDADAWRDKYWRDFETTVTTKLPDWKYEKEQRLTFHSAQHSLAGSEMRTLRYDFHDLEGIIFGMRTPEDKKLEVIRRIRQKCAQSGRSSFAFGQAIRTRDGAAIMELPLPLLSTRAVQSPPESAPHPTTGSLEERLTHIHR